MDGFCPFAGTLDGLLAVEPSATKVSSADLRTEGVHSGFPCLWVFQHDNGESLALDCSFACGSFGGGADGLGKRVLLLGWGFVQFAGDDALAVGGEQGGLGEPLLDELERQGVPLTELRTHSATLEDVFVALTGRRLRDE